MSLPPCCILVVSMEQINTKPPPAKQTAAYAQLARLSATCREEQRQLQVIRLRAADPTTIMNYTLHTNHIHNTLPPTPRRLRGQPRLLSPD